MTQYHHRKSRYWPSQARTRRFCSCLACQIGLLVTFFLAAGSGWGQGVESAVAADPIVTQSALLRVVEQVSTPARVAGVLESIWVKEGDVVEEGALLAKVDDSEAELIYQRVMIEHELARLQVANDIAIRSREKALEFSQQEFLRFKRAADKIPGSISKSELEESQLTAEQAALDLEQAQHDHQLETLTERLKRTQRAIALRNQEIHQILAPINGLVVEVLRRRGEWVEPGEDVLRIMRIDRLRVEGLVAVQDVMQVLKEALVEINVSIPGRADVTVIGRVVFVSPEINPVNSRVRVRAEFVNPGGQLMPGMRAAMVIHPHRVTEAKPATTATGLADPESP